MLTDAFYYPGTGTATFGKVSPLLDGSVVTPPVTHVGTAVAPTQHKTGVKTDPSQRLPEVIHNIEGPVAGIPNQHADGIPTPYVVQYVHGMWGLGQWVYTGALMWLGWMALGVVLPEVQDVLRSEVEYTYKRLRSYGSGFPSRAVRARR